MFQKGQDTDLGPCTPYSAQFHFVTHYVTNTVCYWWGKTPVRLGRRFKWTRFLVVYFLKVKTLINETLEVGAQYKTIILILPEACLILSVLPYPTPPLLIMGM